MSRSKHTRPRRILAASRVREPYEPRGYGDVSGIFSCARVFKEMGVTTEVSISRASAKGRPAPLPRLIVKRPREGFTHPATKADVTKMLRFFGEQYTYGLRSIEMVQAVHTPADDGLALGRLLVPGRIIIYEQALSPWVLPGRLGPKEEQKLRQAGAVIELVGGGSQTSISWPGETLRDFVLFDVLMHEIAHHVLQQYKGKRGVRVLRTKDHEALANKFARECRLKFTEARIRL